MNASMQWARQHDAGKLLLIALAMVPVLLVFFLGTGPESARVALLGGLAICGCGAYWLGNGKWALIPLVVMLLGIVVAIPVSLADPSLGESPLSIILEAPIWTGIPALMGAAAGHVIRRLVAARTR